MLSILVHRSVIVSEAVVGEELGLRRKWVYPEVGLGSYDNCRRVCGQYAAGVSSAGGKHRGVPSAERKHPVKFILI